MKTTFICALLFWLSSASAAWDLNDVSFLLPLPQKLSPNHLLQMESKGQKGVLLKAGWLGEMPPLTTHMTEEDLREALRVLAVRIDPCFPLPTPMACQRQIRLVWQPLELDRRGSVRTVDAALHSFYSLTEEEFQSLLEEISSWKRKYHVDTRGQALQIHPAWSEAKDNSPSLADFHQVILKRIGETNLIRVTAMALRGAGDIWAFSSFVPQSDGSLQGQAIARLSGEQFQTFINLAVPADHFEGSGIFPEPVGEDTINNLFLAPAGSAPPADEGLILKDFKALYRIENPKSFNAENMDCVSCHVAQPAKHFYLKDRPDLKLDLAWNADQYKNSTYNMKNLSPGLQNTQVIRAFGYFGDQMAVNQRVINESAEVADWVNRNFRDSEE